MQGSVINRIMESGQHTQPEVGMPVTICHYSDRSVGIVTEVTLAKKTGLPKAIKVAGVKATRTDDRGMSDMQSYEYGGEPVDTDRTQTWTLRSNGRWAVEGQPSKGSAGIRFGVWDYHYDYSF
jgi:hypothetical protein